MKKLFLLDAYALIYRAYFAFIKNPRYSPKGINTSAIFGFTNTLEQLLKKEEPSHIAVAFDMSEPTFRHKIFKKYKAQREEMPEDIRNSIPYIRKIIEAYNIPIIEKKGYEADDVIGTIAKQACKEDFEVYMITPDKDYAQLVSENIFMYKPKRMGNDVEIWGVEQVMDNFRVSNPTQVIDILALMGDTADNIPGCPGVGPKTAMQLIEQFENIDNIYQNTGKLKGKQKERLQENEEQVRLSKKLATIVLDVPLDIKPEQMSKVDPNREKLHNLFDDLGFTKLAAQYGNGATQQIAFGEGTLFANMSQPVTPPHKVEKQNEKLTSANHNYVLVDSEKKRSELHSRLKAEKEFCFDVETTGLDPHTAEPIGISFSFRDTEAYFVPLPPDPEPAKAIIQEFASVFEDENILKIGQNIKYDILILTRYGAEVKEPYFDTMIAHYLIQPELRHNLDYLSKIYLGYIKIPIESLIGERGKNQRSMRQVPPEKLLEYACEDADITRRLKPILLKEMESTGVTKLFHEIEMPLVKILVSMELSGVKIDKNALLTYAEHLRNVAIGLEKEITELAGEEFNISSPKQLGTILFDKLKLNPKAKKTKTKQYSTSEEVLVQLQNKHSIVQKILEYRGIKKLLSTYVEALPRLVNPVTGKIHTSFNQTVVATGRLSSKNPNMQNIPIRDESGKEIRRAFIPSDKEHIYLSADYSQIELRIMAAMSQDNEMAEAFRKREDIHLTTASKIFGVDMDRVTPEMRRKAKTANFGIIYGISAFGLSQRLNIPRAESKELIDGYFSSFGMVREFIDKQIEQARKDGFVKTMMGRKRYLNDINSANTMVRKIAERNAVNAPIQGSAADIIKIAMINIHRKMEEKGMKSKMILQVHDELNFDAYKPELEELMEIVKFEMENAVQIQIPLTVEIHAAKNWLDAH